MLIAVSGCRLIGADMLAASVDAILGEAHRIDLDQRTWLQNHRLRLIVIRVLRGPRSATGARVLAVAVATGNIVVVIDGSMVITIGRRSTLDGELCPIQFRHALIDYQQPWTASGISLGSRREDQLHHRDCLSRLACFRDLPPLQGRSGRIARSDAGC